ncbi:DUF3152 domain-containing protein [Dactylosporangium vinaceum]|uniref:DUF3152 domain-containing protein n=1 Tax=Dactylosporangium vinaceum TaxID=53362 RepID=A0ABV5MIA9_9ACTN|nr:DUF3152 domain-containing protein [Dactylosporangium vinaceum]UAB97553.1 DUF3152 domain-containing protein [Dactylosporangium vinaceum]
MGRRLWLVLLVASALLAGSSLVWYLLSASSLTGAFVAASASASPTGLESPSAPAPSAALPSGASPSPASPSPASPTPVVVPGSGNGRFDFAGSGGERVGGAGHLVHYVVATEQGSGVDPETFAAAVQRTLGDSRSWIAGGNFSFQRVPAGSASELTVHLATPATTDTMCARRGVRTKGEVSCRGGRDVIINLKRWLLAVAWYPTVTDYRDMVVNHEVGHFLGNGHAVCPRKGAPAPVMARQSFGLEGCVANAWPYPDGKNLVTGPPAPR